MKDDALITRKEMDELLAFLPAFDVPCRDFTVQQSQERAGGFSQAYPQYCEDVQAFFRLAGKPCWCDYEYIPHHAADLLEDEERVRNATLGEIKTLLTFCVRGERFVDGHWGAMLKSGKLVSILKRLAVLRAESSA